MRSADIRLRLAAVWRDVAIVSREFPQHFAALPTTSVAVASPPRLVGAAALTLSSYAICWSDERSTRATAARFRLVLKSRTTDEAIRALEIATSCFLLRNLPTDESCCVAQIETLGGESAAMLGGDSPSPTPPPTPPPLRVVFESAAARSSSSVEAAKPPILVITDGAALVSYAALNDYLMSVEPTSIAILLPADATITGKRAHRRNDSL